jgi:hypothetical protein
MMLSPPSRRSCSVIYICECFASGDLAYSLPSEYYIATYTVWEDPKIDPMMKAWLKKTYEEVEKVSLGMYVADLDTDVRITKVLSHSAALM